ncbi:MAG TPA: glycoside hydrolase family 3 C-terminal domain-containing protein, partial [Lachnospiraceae bacterium]|nr:glycoside hydrolase family 3 C-terminal domain-containing protein [Lachnospiraceae bacterium]
GRGHETYGEDPYLTSRLGVAFIKGLQGTGEFMKTAACAKHYAVHSGPEAVRHEFDAQVGKKDLYETYLPAFEACVKEAGAEGVMGAYNRTNGEPCCAHSLLMEKILFVDWKFKGHYVSDCWAIRDFHEHHMVTKTPEESAALAVNKGCDLNCGNTYLHILKAYREGLIKEEAITRAAVRLFTTRFLLGLFDKSEYDTITYEEVESVSHREFAVEVSEKSMVLLKNNGILPLDKKKLKSIGVIGPNANSRKALIGNYHGTSSRYKTILEGIQEEADDSVKIYYSEGCHLYKDRVENLAWPDDRISEAVIVAKRSDVVILCLGLDESLEGEEGDTGNSYASGDKDDLKLPKSQETLLKAVSETETPVILILQTGSAMDLSFAKYHENVRAILQAWYPGAEGGRAAANLLFGKKSPSGKLPVTFYETLDELPAFEDYNMAGRTYRYISGKAQYPFGYGLTYSTVTLTEAKLIDYEHLKETAGHFPENLYDESFHVSVRIKNMGDCSVEEVIQGYVKDLDSSFAVKNHSLCAFKRTALHAGEEKEVRLTVPARALLAVNEDGSYILDSKAFTLYIGVSQPDEVSVGLCGVKPLEVSIRL